MFITARIHYRQQEVVGPLILQDNANHYVVHNSDNSIYLSLRKRAEYPVTYCQQLSDGSFKMGYGHEGTSDNEYLSITVDRTGRLHIARDAIATLPLFYAWKERRFLMSNVYERVLESLPNPTVFRPQLLNSLAPQQPNIRDTLIQEIKLLAEREVLEVKRDGLYLNQPPSRGWVKSNEAPPSDPQEFPRVLSKHLTDFAETCLHGQPFAFHVSGGLDSATLPFFLSKRFGTRAPLAVVWYPGQQGITQHEKVYRLADYTKSAVLEVPMLIDSDFPLARHILSGEFYPTHVAQNIYEPTFLRQARQLKAEGIRVLCTGLGGDDIFENVVSGEPYFGYGPEEVKRRQTEPLPEY